MTAAALHSKRPRASCTGKVSSNANGFKATNGTRTFTDVDDAPNDQGEVRNFNDSEGCMWGMDCQPHTFPSGEIGAVATLVEHDHGSQKEVLNGWTGAFNAAEEVLAASGVAAWVVAIVAAIQGIGGWIIGTFEDDHIADAAWTFSRASINEVLGKHGGSYDQVQIFTDGDARYRLRIRISRVV